MLADSLAWGHDSVRFHIPTDNYIRLMLDGAAPAAFDGLFMTAVATIAAADALAQFQRLGGRVLIALDGTEHFCSRKIHCPQCSKRRRSDGGVEYFCYRRREPAQIWRRACTAHRPRRDECGRVVSPHQCWPAATAFGGSRH